MPETVTAPSSQTTTTIHKTSQSEELALKSYKTKWDSAILALETLFSCLLTLPTTTRDKTATSVATMKVTSWIKFWTITAEPATTTDLLSSADHPGHPKEAATLAVLTSLTKFTNLTMAVSKLLTCHLTSAETAKAISSQLLTSPTSPPTTPTRPTKPTTPESHTSTAPESSSKLPACATWTKSLTTTTISSTSWCKTSTQSTCK